MLIITHVRLDGRGRFYENITEVWCETPEFAFTPSVTIPLPKALSVAHLIAEIRKGVKVFTKGEPLGEVEVFDVYGFDYIRSKSSATSANDLLSLPSF